MYLDLAELDPAELDSSGLPDFPELTAIILAELHQGVAMARNPSDRAVRSEQVGTAAESPQARSHDRRHRVGSRAAALHPRSR
ncbi:PilT domain-containing protein [Amycolatopsis methanolica 239]|uniref:PilT domain-containing protein n=1 Tax=Amycolatopsis methanolica 239 TaxID=1068978 RepID=A0A076MUV5_AMYME|nr:PilT domain-containing protein [Amycolatopsis methanolica 239]